MLFHSRGAGSRRFPSQSPRRCIRGAPGAPGRGPPPRTRCLPPATSAVARARTCTPAHSPGCGPLTSRRSTALARCPCPRELRTATTPVSLPLANRHVGQPRSPQGGRAKVSALFLSSENRPVVKYKFLERRNPDPFEPLPVPAVRPIGPRFGHQRMPQESVMKCANPTCNHSIGLVSHRRGLFGKRPYCSKQCRDHLAVAPAPKSERATTSPSNGCSCSR